MGNEHDSERNVSIRTITRRVETSELGQLVSNPLPCDCVKE